MEGRGKCDEPWQAVFGLDREVSCTTLSLGSLSEGRDNRRNIDLHFVTVVRHVGRAVGEGEGAAEWGLSEAGSDGRKSMARNSAAPGYLSRKERKVEKRRKKKEN